jgi:hypothetical protein
VRHARPEDLDRLAPLLEALRALPGIKEKARGVFYRGSKAFLHFHEDAGGLFADLRRDNDFERFPVTTAKERSAFLTAARKVLRDA